MISLLLKNIQWVFCLFRPVRNKYAIKHILLHVHMIFFENKFLLAQYTYTLKSLVMMFFFVCMCEGVRVSLSFFKF